MALEVGKSALLGVIISFVLVVLYAVALKEELLQVSTMGLFTTVIKVICAAAAGLIAVRRCKSGCGCMGRWRVRFTLYWRS